MSHAHSRTAGWIIVFLALAAAAWGCWQLLLIFPWILRGSMDPDIPLYFVIGRGILNGLTPYVDLFETKPPGMFLLTALSLLVTGNQTFLGMLTTLALFGTALLPSLFVWRSRRGQPWTLDATIAGLTALGAGILLALYLERFATGMDTENFGGVIGAVYALSLLRTFRRGWTGMLVRALLLLGAIGLKEYYLFVLFAVALLLTRDTRDFLRAFVFPLLLAGVIGVVLLFMLGYLQPYLTVYLPELLGHRVSSDPLRPLPLLALDPYPLGFHFFQQFTSSRFLPLMLGGLFFLLPALRSRQPLSWQRALLHALTGITVVIFLLELVPALMTLNGYLREGTVLTFSRSFSPMLLTVCTLVLVVLLFLQRLNHTLSHVLRGLLALYAVLYAIAGAGYAGNHYASALPVYAALVLLGLAFGLKEGNRVFLYGMASVVILALLPYRTTADHWAVITDSVSRSAQTQSALTERLDGLMDRCRIERFRSLFEPLRFAFARHSPWGPIVTFDLDWKLDPSHPLMMATDRHLTQDNQLLLTGQTIPSPADVFVSTYFTETPPDCAKPFLPMGEYRVWFRK